jgi:glycosyltransferase involved in cell wall biosynthesis
MVPRSDGGTPVLLIAYHFPPSGAIGGQRLQRFYDLLPRFGIRPFVLTIGEHVGESYDPSTPARYTGPREDIVRIVMMRSFREQYRGLKRALDSLRRRSASEAPLAGATVAAERQSGDLSSVAGRLLSLRKLTLAMMKMPDEAFSAWFLPAVRAGLTLIRRHRIRAVLASSPPPSSLLVALTLKRLTGVRLIADFRDPWAGTVPGWGDLRMDATDSIHAMLERPVVRAADHVVSVTARITRFLRERYPEVDPGRFVTIPNAVDLRQLGDVSPLPSDGKFTLIHAGSLYGRRDPTPLFRGLERAVEGGLGRDQVRLTLIGDQGPGVEAIRERARAAGVGDLVSVDGVKPRGEVLTLSRRAQVIVILAQDQPLQIPGKVYEAAALMKPILAITEEGATRDVLRDAGGASIVDPEDVDGVARSLLAIHRAPALSDEDVRLRRAFMAAMDPMTLTESLARLMDDRAPGPTNAAASFDRSSAV